jgi:predicted RNase H-like HicB family nuclease
MKKLQYLVRINRDPGSDWGASVLDLPGCVATGRTIDSTLRRIARAIELHIQGLREDGLSVPRPSHRTVTPRRRPKEIDFYATVEVAA